VNQGQTYEARRIETGAGDAPASAKAPPESRRVMIGVGFIALLAVLDFGSEYIAGRARSRFFPSVPFVLGALPIFALLSVGFRVASRRRLGALPMLFGGFVLAGLLGAGLGSISSYAEHRWLHLHPPFRPEEARASPRAEEGFRHRAVLFGFFYGQVCLGIWALAFVFPHAVEDARVRSLEADKLRLEADQLRSAAELAHLRAHLEPHFLLNTLSAIAGFVTDDPREARRLLVCLGDLLRDALHDEAEMQTLGDQISWLRRYAEILEARHAGHLVFRWDIASETERVLLPRLLLQPLVENAVKHGALRRGGDGKVTVRAKEVVDTPSPRMICTVEDNGPGMPSAETRSGAFGLHAVRRRLALKYSGRAHLLMESTPEGTRSIVEVPCTP
jgi:signal transduction histidine kinase